MHASASSQQSYETPKETIKPAWEQCERAWSWEVSWERWHLTWELMNPRKANQRGVKTKLKWRLGLKNSQADKAEDLKNSHVLAKTTNISET